MDKPPEAKTSSEELRDGTENGRGMRRASLSLSWLLATGLLLVWGLGPARAAGDAGVRVGLVRAQATASAGAQGQALVLDGSGSPLGFIGGEAALASPGGDVISVPGLGLFPGPLALRPGGQDTAAAGYVTVGGHAYRGELEVFARDGLVTVVNVVPLEDYLLGVVPREMPAGFPAEALKAQAVAARTYALHTVASGAYAALGYDLVPTTDCQVYGGVDAEQASTTVAVEATSGEVITYGGGLIGAFFHSTSGGHTESVEYVWGFPSPYLKGVPDFDQASPHYTWTLTFDAAELSSRLAEAGYDVGDLVAVEGVAPQGPGGRYLERLLRGSRGEQSLRSERLRQVLGLRSAWFDVTGAKERVEDAVRQVDPAGFSVVSAEGAARPLAGDTFVALGYGVAAVVRPEGLWAVSSVHTPATFTFTGRGWGHGVGLSQWGARGMALAGKDYREILTYYYTGVTVGTLP